MKVEILSISKEKVSINFYFFIYNFSLTFRFFLVSEFYLIVANTKK
jgi:hypothetical protein